MDTVFKDNNNEEYEDEEEDGGVAIGAEAVLSSLPDTPRYRTLLPFSLERGCFAKRLVHQQAFHRISVD